MRENPKDLEAEIQIHVAMREQNQHLRQRLARSG